MFPGLPEDTGTAAKGNRESNGAPGDFARSLPITVREFILIDLTSSDVGSLDCVRRAPHFARDDRVERVIVRVRRIQCLLDSGAPVWPLGLG